MRLPRVQLCTQKKVQRSGRAIMKMSEDKEKLTKKAGKQKLPRKEEKQTNTHSGSQGKRVSRRRQLFSASNSAYSSPKTKVKENN